jgi:hypothetical protein
VGVWLKAFRSVRGRRGIFEAIRKSKDPSTFMVFFEDSAALLGIVIAFIGIFLGNSCTIRMWTA